MVQIGVWEIGKFYLEKNNFFTNTNYIFHYAGQRKYDASPAISMISKHENGSLNLWDVTFSPDSSFSQLLNIGHKARVNGHRFRVNEITSHPVLPLLLTTR